MHRMLSSILAISSSKNNDILLNILKKMAVLLYILKIKGI